MRVKIAFSDHLLPMPAHSEECAYTHADNDARKFLFCLGNL